MKATGGVAFSSSRFRGSVFPSVTNGGALLEAPGEPPGVRRLMLEIARLNLL